MAAWLLAAGQPGHRLATPNSRIMLHQASAGFLGTSADIKVAAENVIKLEELCVNILARHVGKQVDDLATLIQRDVWLTAQEAVDFGVIDAIAPPSAAKMASVGSTASQGSGEP